MDNAMEVDTKLLGNMIDWSCLTSKEDTQVCPFCDKYFYQYDSVSIIKTGSHLCFIHDECATEFAESYLRYPGNH